jgi:hypothetical protein
MIIGVDERDRTNTAAARPLANSLFVLLDGKEKRADFEADTSHRYYRLITAFDHNHQTFCREFLQMLDIAAPTSDICHLFDCFTALEDATSLPNAQTLVKILSILGRYGVINSPTLKNLYNRIKTELTRFLHDDLNNALQILNWLQTVSKVVRDNNASQQLTGIVCKEFADQVFNKPDAQKIVSFWKSIRNTEFASSAAGHLVDPSTLQSYNEHIRQFSAADAITFVLMYLECAAFLGSVNDQNLKKIVDIGLQACLRGNDTNSAHKIIKALSQNRQILAQTILLSIAKEAHKDYAEFIVKSLVETDKSIVASDASLLAFFKKLKQNGIEHLFILILKYRIRALSSSADIEQFIKLAKEFQSLSSHDLAEVFEKLDSRLVITEKGSTSAAYALQQAKPEEAVCPNSAHLYALEALNDKRMRTQFTSIYNKLITQRFPSVDTPDYIKALIERLFKAQMNQRELEYIIRLFARVPSYIAELVNTIFGMTKPKQNEEWCVLIAVAEKERNRVIDDAIVEACVKLRHGEKALAQLNELLASKETHDYFMHIAEEAKERIRMLKPRSGFDKFFRMLSGDDSDKK